MLVATLNAGNVGVAATPAEAVTAAALGAAFACIFLTPSLAIVLPGFVGIVAAVLGGPGEVLGRLSPTEGGDPLTLDLPDWGTGLAAGRLGVADLVFAGVFMAYARRFGLRPVATAAGIGVALVAALVLEVEAGLAVPALPLMAAAYFLVNTDRLPALFERIGEG
jgi:hypothetical protein